MRLAVLQIFYNIFDHETPIKRQRVFQRKQSQYIRKIRPASTRTGLATIETSTVRNKPTYNAFEMCFLDRVSQTVLHQRLAKIGDVRAISAAEPHLVVRDVLRESVSSHGGAKGRREVALGAAVDLSERNATYALLSLFLSLFCVSLKKHHQIESDQTKDSGWSQDLCNKWKRNPWSRISVLRWNSQ